MPGTALPICRFEIWPKSAERCLARLGCFQSRRTQEARELTLESGNAPEHRVRLESYERKFLSLDPSFDMGPTPLGDGVVDAQDLEVLMSYWGTKVHDPHFLAHWMLDETDGDVAYNSAAENDAAPPVPGSLKCVASPRKSRSWSRSFP